MLGSPVKIWFRDKKRGFSNVNLECLQWKSGVGLQNWGLKRKVYGSSKTSESLSWNAWGLQWKYKVSGERF